jgi:hypothetical protein
MAKIAVSMGGRAAEEVVMNTMTNGASQDIQEATAIARNMVAMFGMSDEFGMMALASRRNMYLDGGYGMDCAQDTAAAMDKAVKEILDKCYKTAVEILQASREDMDKVVEYLLEKETITGGEMVAIIEGRDPATAEDHYFSNNPDRPEGIEAPAKKVHMISQKIEAPELPGNEESPESPAEGRVIVGVAVLRGLPVAIGTLTPAGFICGTGVFVLDGIVGGVDLFHFFLGGFVAGVDVGVILLGQLAVGLFDLLVAGIAADAQHFIGISHAGVPSFSFVCSCLARAS